MPVQKAILSLYVHISSVSFLKVLIALHEHCSDMQLRALLLFQAPGMGRQRSLVARGLRVLAQQDQEAEAQLAAAPDRRLSVLAASPTATQLLAHFCACELRPADCYLLYGSVGAGKSYFRCAARQLVHCPRLVLPVPPVAASSPVLAGICSRAFIRAAAKDEELPVPSPTFLLQNIYTDHQGENGSTAVTNQRPTLGYFWS